MIHASKRWEELQNLTLLPEMHVEVTCAITEIGVQTDTTVSATDEEVFSVVGQLSDGVLPPSDSTRYATLEHNLWSLDGSLGNVPNKTAQYFIDGYVSTYEAKPTITMSFPEVRTGTVPGVTLCWSSVFGDYATDFRVTAKNGNTVVATTTVENNTEKTVLVHMEMANYDSVVVEVLGWSLPNRRVRIDQFMVGFNLTFTKSDIIRFTHEQYGDINSGSLPKNSIEFSVNNIDGRWNPTNPTGMEQYLSERQLVTVRYGMDVDGKIEWIPGGVFYLSEWKAPSNGLEATFSARDVFEYLLNESYPEGWITDPFYKDLVDNVTTGTVPSDVAIYFEPNALIDVWASPNCKTTDGETYATIVQRCANATGCVIRWTRYGELYISPLNTDPCGYVILSQNSYSHPEITLSKQLKDVSVSYVDGEENKTYVLNVGNSGETQTVNNSFIRYEEQAAVIAGLVRDALVSRKTVSGDFRADPRLDLFDVVSVESKYGDITPVVITNIKYSFSGSFRANYTGRVLK